MGLSSWDRQVALRGNYGLLNSFLVVIVVGTKVEPLFIQFGEIDGRPANSQR